MIIRNFAISNQAINIQGINMRFSVPGYYRISGENGCGKTTLLEKILFGDAAEFSSLEETELYKRERSSLFSYCPQKIITNRLRVDRYISRGNRFVDNAQIKKLFEIFNLRDESLGLRFCDLSGGEQMKVSIISCLIKDTPYLILDEPSNYLDNTSTEALSNLLRVEADRRCVIVVSHDNRMADESQKVYSFSAGTVRFDGGGELATSATNDNVIRSDNSEIAKKTKTGIIDRKKAGVKAFDAVHMFCIFLRNRAVLLTTALVVVLAVIMLWLAERHLKEEVGENDAPPVGVITVLRMGYQDEYSNLYVKEAGVQINSESENREVTIADVPALYEMDGVREIYIPAEAFLLNVYSNINAPHIVPIDVEHLYHPKEKVSCVAIPNEIMKSGSSTVEYLLKLRAGRPPIDGAEEIAPSVEFLTECYGYTEANVEKAIGEYVSVLLPGEKQERVLLVVGIMALPYELLSYEEKLGLGFYRYNADSYEGFCKTERELMLCYGFSDTEIPDSFDELIILVDEEKEPQMTMYLHANYPCSYHYSRNFYETLEKMRLVRAGRHCLWINIAASIILSSLAFLFCKNSIRYNVGLLWDLGNYYINRKKVIGHYAVVLLSIIFLLFISILAVVVRTSSFRSWMGIYTLVYWLFVSSAVLGSVLHGKKGIVREYGVEF